jgi:hypothetical protein
MLVLFLHLVLVLCLTATPSLAQTAQQGLSTTRHAEHGDAATGETLIQEEDQLQLNTSPCSEGRTVVIFRKPYTVEPAGTINCPGPVEKNLVQAIQK